MQIVANTLCHLRSVAAADLRRILVQTDFDRDIGGLYLYRWGMVWSYRHPVLPLRRQNDTTVQ